MTAPQKTNNMIKISPSSNGIPSPSRSRIDPQYAARLQQRSSPNKHDNSPSRFMYRVNRMSQSNASLSPARSTTSSNSAASSFIYSDRYIPSRNSSNLENFVDAYDENCPATNSTLYGNRFGSNNSSIHNGIVTEELNDVSRGSEAESPQTAALPNDEPPSSAADNSIRQSHLSHQPMMGALLRSELFGENDYSGMHARESGAMSYQSPPRRVTATSQNSSPMRENAQTNSLKNSYRFQSPRKGKLGCMSSDSILKAFNLTSPANTERYMMGLSQQRKRRIPKVPFKVLDAPALKDDFYLNLVDWSSQNVLAVGLGTSVYLWSACTSKVTKLCDLAEEDDSISSVSWTQRGTHLAVGTNRGEVQLWDTVQCIKIRSMMGHTARVGTLGWTGSLLASGSRDRNILLRDARCQDQYIAKLSNCGHKQEVCGLKWSYDEPAHLASGGNDNKLLVWDIKKHSQPLHKFCDHKAAVKAIAWSPHQHGLLVSGGGTADRCIKFWNTMSGVCLNSIDTGSQVCNLAWAKNCNEIVSTHGYSLNQIIVWRYPSMDKVVTLTGHTYRVLYLSMSPDGSAICTGAGDETIRFWQVFKRKKGNDKNTGSGLLFPSTPGAVIR